MHELRLEERIPGYGGSYYDWEQRALVVRIIPRLNPTLARMLGDQASALPLGRELRLPRPLALDVTSQHVVHSVRDDAVRSTWYVVRSTW